MTTGTSSMPDVEALEQRLHVRVAFDVEVDVREAVAVEELRAGGACPAEWREPISDHVAVLGADQRPCGAG